MEMGFVIADLKKQKEQLDVLIWRLKQKELPDQGDLNFYDLTTKQIEKHLRTLRQWIAEETFPNTLNVKTRKNENEHKDNKHKERKRVQNEI